MNLWQTIPLTTAALLTLLGAKLHANKIWVYLKKRLGNYVAGFGYYFAVAVFIILHSWVHVILWNDAPYEWNTLWLTTGWGLVTWAEYWFLFDGFLNLLRDRPWGEVSVTNGKLTDRIFDGDYGLQLMAKLAMAGIGVVLIIIFA